METGGTVLSLELAGGKAAAFRFLNALEIVLISNNLGDAKSDRHPSGDDDASAPDARAARERSASATGLVRLSVGLEDRGRPSGRPATGAGGGLRCRETVARMRLAGC